ncbi:unnamed protein product [Prorocentrum cordatum]|uniref:SET domain-containing protein n=1 Tax=Prorocentrum cordatum TaxID=2364126 RepID=A0ABN9Q1I1_9DINO|nr:unnamed protein product [Polarella glacialis]
MNHDSRTTTKLDLSPLSGCWELRSGSAVAAGSEVTISYGKKSNDTLLLQHGFVEEDNPHEEILLPMPGAYWMKNEAKGVKSMRGKDGKAMDVKFSRKGKAMPMEEGKFRVKESLWDWIVEWQNGPPPSWTDDPRTFGRVCIETLDGELAQRFQQSADGAILESLESRATAELLLQWRREKRRLLGEAIAKYAKYRDLEAEVDDETRRNPLRSFFVPFLQGVSVRCLPRQVSRVAVHRPSAASWLT